MVEIVAILGILNGQQILLDHHKEANQWLRELRNN